MTVPEPTIEETYEILQVGSSTHSSVQHTAAGRARGLKRAEMWVDSSRSTQHKIGVDIERMLLLLQLLLGRSRKGSSERLYPVWMCCHAMGFSHIEPVAHIYINMRGDPIQAARPS